MIKEIENKVEKFELVDWRNLKWFQGELKELTTINYEKLKNSIVKNNFISPFYVTTLEGEINILDGHHRKKVMELIEKDGYKIPQLLPAVFVKCENKTEAGKILLAINSHYAKITDEGLYEFINNCDIDFESVKNDIEIPDINIEKFENGFVNDFMPENKEKEIDELNTENECPKCGYKW